MRRIMVALIAVLVLLPASAWADSISYNGVQIPGLTVKGKVHAGWFSYNVTASTGEFDIGWDEKEVLAAYCADILSHGVGGIYDVQSLTSFDYQEYGDLYQAAWIMENYSPSLASVEGAYTYTELVTAVQSAIWSLTSNWDLSKVYGSHTQKDNVTTLYYQMLAEASGVDFSTYKFEHDYHYADSQQGRQDLLFATEGSGAAAPEPGGLLLMGSALSGALGYWRIRRKKMRKA